MVWRADGPQGYESAKVGFELVEFLHGRVLDLGCGPKKLFPGPHIVGLDNDKDLKLFGTKSNAQIYCDCERLDMFADDAVDTVFSSHMIEHIVDYQAALAEWWRVIKPGGYLIVYAPHADWYPNVGMPGANPDHKHDFRNADITEAMRKVAWRSGRGWDQLRDEVRSEGHEYSLLQVYRKRPGPGTADYVPAPKPEKSLGLVRLGAYGDALWITTVLPALKAEGWHITLYCQPEGEASLRYDPHIDKIICQASGLFGQGAEAAQYQGAYWLACERRHDRFINLVGCVERHLLPHPSDPNFYLPDQQRRRLMGRNYLANVAEWAGVEFVPGQVRIKFTPSAEEMAWAAAKRAEFDGPLVVINPSGSSLPKWWPYTQEAMRLFDAAGVHSVVLGDLRGQKIADSERGRVIGTGWSIRQCYALAALAEVVIGTESAIINSVAHEPPLKIVLLSHSSAINLTRDWDRTIAVEPDGLACYPCHRIHQDWQHCTRNKDTGWAACQSAASAATVVQWALQWIKGELKEAA